MTPDYANFVESKKQIDSTMPKRDFRSTVIRAKGIENSLEMLDFEHMQTNSKHIDIKISPQLRNFFKNYNASSEDKRHSISRLRELSQGLVENLKAVEKIYTEMGRICAHLHQTSVEFNQENKNSENEIAERTFSALQNTFISLGEVIRKEGENSKKSLLELFGSWEQELVSLDEIVKIRNTVGHDYVTLKTDLKDKKIKILTSPGMKAEFDMIAIKYSCIDRESEDFQRQKHKFLLPEATKTAHRVAGCFGFINNWVYDQILIYSHSRNLKTMVQLEHFCKAEIGHISLRQVAVGELQSDVDTFTTRLQELQRDLPVL